MSHCFHQATIKARKDHTCTWCGNTIHKGEHHQMWKSVEDSWFTNRMHAECVDACREEIRLSRDSEYTPYENERPEVTK